MLIFIHFELWINSQLKVNENDIILSNIIC